MGLGIKSRILHYIAARTGKYELFGAGYHEWQSRRIRAMVDHYGHRFFEGLAVTELGAGFGDIGGFFSMLGSKVTCLEGRQSNVDEMKKRYPVVKAAFFDCNNTLPVEARNPFIIHFGVLYHLRNPEASLRDTCRACIDMALETECLDSDDPNLFRPNRELAYVKDHAIDGQGCCPSPAFVERILIEEGMSFTRIEDARFNVNGHFYDWPIKNTGRRYQGQRKFWFVKKNGTNPPPDLKSEKTKANPK